MSKEGGVKGTGPELEPLTVIMERLLGTDGCPWDREQNFSTLVPYLIEEAYEVVAAIDSGSRAELKEELGDLLFQIVFLSELARKEGSFDIAEVIKSAVEKMVRRHPHVFEDAEAETSGEVVRRWSEIKEREKHAKKDKKSEGFLSDVPHTFPSLMRAHKLTKRAAKVGFDWENADGAIGKLTEELSEFKDAVKSKEREAIGEELGDLLFSIVNVARLVEVEPEEALRRTIGKFIYRFHYVEERLKERGGSLEGATLEEMERLWVEAKEKEGSKTNTKA